MLDKLPVTNQQCHSTGGNTKHWLKPVTSSILHPPPDSQHTQHCSLCTGATSISDLTLPPSYLLIVRRSYFIIHFWWKITTTMTMLFDKNENISIPNSAVEKVFLIKQHKILIIPCLLVIRTPTRWQSFWPFGDDLHDFLTFHCLRTISRILVWKVINSCVT